MQPPLAYHLTWTCYGQWLHGDPRGFVDDEHRTPGEDYARADPQRYNAARNLMAEPPCWLTDGQRRIATAALREACAFRSWPLEAVNVQPDHVHIVIRAPTVLGKQVMAKLKGRATMWLHEQAPGRRTWWTEGGKVELVRGERHLAQVVQYVSNQPFARVE